MPTSIYEIISAISEASIIRNFLVTSVTITFALYSLYQWLLPKPIPGIPYNPEAARSLFGDVPEMVKEVGMTGEFRVWCAKQMKKMDSSICQIFIRPFSQPWILLADYREARHILMRCKEFDKSSFLSEGMACIGAFHGVYITGDEFKSNRQLIQDLMTTSFLNKQVGPAIFNKGLELMRLFEMKMNLANGRPFSVKTDYEYTSLDVMLEFAFGKNWLRTSLGPQVDLVSKLDASDINPGALDQPVIFSTAPVTGFLNSVYETPEIIEKTINAVLPKLQTWWWSKQSWYKKIFDDKERAMKEQVKIAVKNFNSGHVETAIEHMLMREAARASKEGRKPDFENKVFRDELFGTIIGGHHTTSGAMMWLTKYLADFPHVQTNLRSVLFETLSTAKAENRIFTFEEIRQANVPYLDAVIEEMLRINAVPVTREALCDTSVLGYPIKKGTQVFFMSNGPGFLSPSIPIDESRRSEASRWSKLNASWDEMQDLAVFDPNRWIVRKNNSDGLLGRDIDFDGAAGPQMVFGLGARSCWGRRLANMEIRIIIAMLVWNFELLQAPPELSGYSGLEGIARVPKKCYVRLRKL